jgi:ribosomal protein L37E
MKEKIVLEGWICKRCGHKWIPKKKDVPRSCPNPKCRSIYWDRPRKKKVE